ncbi:DKNYY domain-containing protein [Capnocytophaga gingivalis]|uniref:DKNYY domain-containing protein n=1 Tax=Capnocytophaga gingivalis TaxID=1017 RepID=A0ABU5YA75_9FLAO|nr:DKNYY domain-containing protein [Capnocytophaga gingivalis]MEB3040842.1 DKNYY domain-containing protein [Capnocytophaga gingivalis]
MNRLLLFTLLLVACKQKPVEQLPTTTNEKAVEQDTILVSDIHRTDSHSLWIWEYKHPYVEGYIINQDYVIYQEENTRKIIKPDMASFAILGSGLAKDKNGIYYQGDFIKIDTTCFRVVDVIRDKQSDYREEPIWRTYKKAFRGTKQINISDPATFESVSTCYFKDKNYLYYYDQKVEGADVATLQKERAEGKFVSDKNNTYYQGKPFIYKGERVQQVSNNIYKTATHVLRYYLEYDEERAKDYFIELPDYFDIPTLRRLNDFYLIDKNHLYYDESGYPLEDKDLRVPIPKENLSKIKLFEVLVTDGNKVYRGKKPLSGYDVATFRIVPGHYYYLYDKNGVYDWDYKLPFRYTNRPEYGKNLFYMDDQDLFVYEDQAYYKTYEDSLYVSHLTPQQLALLKEGNTPLRELFSSQDDKQKNKEIDTTGFEQLSYSSSRHNPFWRHNGQIYHLIEWWYDNDQHKWRRSERRYVVVKGYDNASLRVVPNGFLADKDYWYDGTTRLFQNKDVELLAIIVGRQQGCRVDSAPGTVLYLFKNAGGYWLAELGREGVMSPLTDEQVSKLLNRQ